MSPDVSHLPPKQRRCPVRAAAMVGATLATGEAPETASAAAPAPAAAYHTPYSALQAQQGG